LVGSIEKMSPTVARTSSTSSPTMSATPLLLWCQASPSRSGSTSLVPVIRADDSARLTNRAPRLVIAMMSTRPTAIAGPPRHGPSTTSAVGTTPEAAASSRATAPHPARAVSPARASRPMRSTTPTMGRPASTPAWTTRATASVSCEVIDPRNQATGRSSNPGSCPISATT
jgi:hypothetical protein